MSQSNLERTRAGIDAFKRGDIVAWMEYFHEDVVWIPAELPDIRPSHGKAGMLDMMQAYLEPWDEFEVETLELEEHGDTVLWTYVQTVSQKDSGLKFDTELTAIFDIRDDLVTRMRYFWDRADARKAIGLAE